MIKKKTLIIIPILLLAVWGILIFLFPKFYSLGIQCFILKNYDIYCPGCGLSRSLHYLVDFQFIESFLVYPSLLLGIFLFAVWYLLELISIIRKKLLFKGDFRYLFLIIEALSVIIHCIYVNFV